MITKTIIAFGLIDVICFGVPWVTGDHVRVEHVWILLVTLFVLGISVRLFIYIDYWGNYKAAFIAAAVCLGNLRNGSYEKAVGLLNEAVCRLKVATRTRLPHMDKVNQKMGELREIVATMKPECLPSGVLARSIDDLDRFFLETSRSVGGLGTVLANEAKMAALWSCINAILMTVASVVAAWCWSI